MIPRLSATTIFLAAASLAAACAPTAQEEPGIPTFEEFRSGITHVKALDRYIIEGDILVDEDGLREYYLDRVQRFAAARAETQPGPLQRTTQPLAVRNTGGVDRKWDQTTKTNLTYCIDSPDFDNDYQNVVMAMNAAAASWERVANVNFIHRNSSDSICRDAGGVLFKVRKFDFPGTTLASAFFPDAQPSDRRVWIDPSALTSGFLGAILIHELGHVLGFVHETTRQMLNVRTGSACGWENENWRPLTDLDSTSIMTCTTDATSVRTRRDGHGAGCAYGQPSHLPPVNPMCGSGDVLSQGAYYRSHIANIGWLPEVRNDDISGTMGMGARLEAFSIRGRFLRTGFRICYTAHVSGMGWQGEVCDGATAGTTGQSRAVEAIRVRMIADDPACTVTYQVHAAGIGWMTPASNNAEAGTTGQSRQLEAIRVRVSGACMGSAPF